MNPDLESPQAELKRRELLQSAEISHELVRNALTKKRIKASDVEVAIGYARELAFTLNKLKLALLGVEVE